MPADDSAAAARILLVGLDEDSAHIFTAALEHAGFSVQVLDAPERVIDVALADRSRLVITSYPVYAEHGVTVTEALRSDPRTMHVPIFNAATHVLPQELEAAAAAGVSYSLSLPASLATVVAGVRRLLDEPPSPDG